MITKRMSTPSIQPKSKEELRQIIQDRMSKEGDFADLNDVDVSQVKDFSFLFAKYIYKTLNLVQLVKVSNELAPFKGDISKWNVSNALYMNSMFEESMFNGDISNLDVSKVITMSSMFAGSHFNQDLSRWSLDSINEVLEMFARSRFEGHGLEAWNLHTKHHVWMQDMFKNSALSQKYGQDKTPVEILIRIKQDYLENTWSKKNNAKKKAPRL